MISTIFLSAFVWLPLDRLISLIILRLFQYLDLLLYMLNFSLSHSTFPSWKLNCSSTSFLKLIIPLLLHLFALSRSSLSSQSCLSTSASHSLMPLSQILISFPLVSPVFVETARRQNCFTSLTSCFVISTIRLTSIVRWTSQRLSILLIMIF